MQDCKTLVDYIKENYKTQVDFAKSQNVPPQQITKWINAGYIVVDHVMYSKRRNL